MEDSSKQSTQFRFLAAFTLSMAVLFGWSYFFAPQPPVEDPNNPQVANTAVTPQAANTPAPAAPQPTPEVAASTPDTTPSRQIRIKSQL